MTWKIRNINREINAKVKKIRKKLEELKEKSSENRNERRELGERIKYLAIKVVRKEGKNEGNNILFKGLEMK